MKRRPLHDVLADWLTNRVLPGSEDVMFKWRLLVEDACRAGQTFSQPDLIVAATALHRGLTVVSRDVSDVEGSRPVISRWSDQR